MLCLSGFELYSRWVPLTHALLKTIGGHIVHNFVNPNGLLLKFKTEQKYTTINLRGICYISINFSLLK